jgi:hypothetical protein
MNFFDEKKPELDDFVQAAAPKPDKSVVGVYAYAGKAPFLQICGQRFHHAGIPVVPVLHVKQWPLKKNSQRYTEPMEKPKCEIKQIFGRS